MSNDFLSERFIEYLGRYRASFPDAAAVGMLQAIWLKDLERHHWISEELYLEAEDAVIDEHHSTFMFPFADLLAQAKRLYHEHKQREQGERVIAERKAWRRDHFGQGGQQ